MNKEEISKLLVTKNVTVKQAWKQIDATGRKVLYVVDEQNKLIGSITDGDIRRHFFNEGNFSDSVESVYHRNPTFAYPDLPAKEIKELMQNLGVPAIPLIDKKTGTVIAICMWEDVSKEDLIAQGSISDCSVIIMAGGKGTRLDPFTRILPKALVPIGDTPILEVIMSQFSHFCCHEFYVVLGHKAEMIMSYFENADCGFKINYVREKTPLGTAGGIQLLPPDVSDDFFVTNCDIIIKGDYEDVLKFHREHKNDITLIAATRHVTIPYGIVEMTNGNQLGELIEKPEYDYKVNSGMYVVNRRVLEFIEKGKAIDFDRLIHLVQKRNGKVGVYLVSEKSWLDIGQWEEYNNSVKTLNLE